MNKLYNKILDRIYKLSNENYFNCLDYLYKKSGHLIKFHDYISPLNFYYQIRNSKIVLEYTKNIFKIFETRLNP